MRAEIYGAAWCTYCNQAKSLLESKGIGYDYIDVDEGSNLKILTERMGSPARSVPQIFLDGMHLPGGYTGLIQELAKG